MKPKIGLLAEVDNERYSGVKGAYAAAVEAAGGLPLLLPFSESESTLEAYAEALDGFVFTGGADLDPRYFGEAPKKTLGIVYPLRDQFELRFFKTALALKKPIFGICRGLQVINVALGGTLYQDLPTEYETSLSHKQAAPNTEPSHEIRILPDTPLSYLIGKATMMGNSFHHQAIKALGRGLFPTATAEDGIIEAVSLEGYPYLRAYQWHPERLCSFDADNLRLFEDFIAACRQPLE